MKRLPRLSVGTVQDNVDRQPILWAVLNVLHRFLGNGVQSFLSQARFDPHDGALSSTGLPHRHLDSWLMTPNVCRQLFVHGSENCSVAVVEGNYGRLPGDVDGRAGGSLDTLCEWLDLPRIVTLDAAQLGSCRRLKLPPDVDGLLLDRIADDGHYYRLQTSLEALYGVPVLGGMGSVPKLRSIASRLSPGCDPTPELCQALGDQLLRHLDLGRLLKIADKHGFGRVGGDLFCCDDFHDLVVAVAFDKAFNEYFPDTLDLLESKGATLRDFSPLRDDRLPDDTDIVYLGCGPAFQFAETLAGNCCMKNALHRHAAAGKRLYAECSGMAYLCQEMIIGQQRFPMTGLLPANALRNSHDNDVDQPLEVNLGRASWLGDGGRSIRGYLDSHWQIEVLDPACSLVADPEQRGLLMAYRNAIASCLHLDFAAAPELFRSFLETPTLPCR